VGRRGDGKGGKEGGRRLEVRLEGIAPQFKSWIRP